MSRSAEPQTPDNRDGAGILPDIRRRRAGRSNAAAGHPDSCIESRTRHRRNRPDQAGVVRIPRLDTRLKNNIIKGLK